jgi:hypothetical protein
MRHRVAVIALTALVLVVCRAAVAPAQEAARPTVSLSIDDWGTIVDPVGDCTITSAAGALTIKVPGAYHDLWPGRGKVNAPLVLQDVEGDFTIEVLVKDVTKAEADTVLPDLASKASFHAASLVIWQDAKNFVRFDRTDMHHRDRSVNACYLHIFAGGERTVELAPTVPDRPTNLRLARKGERLTASYSQNGGGSWTSLPEQRIALADKVKAGVSALNTTSRENVVTFADLKITK